MNKVYLVISIILACSIFVFGQKTNAKKAPLADSNSPEKQVVLATGTTIEAQLEKTIDVNTAQIGDQISLKTTKTIRQNGEVIIPRGSNLVGRITEVQKRTKENQQSKLGMIFDRVQGKNLSAPFSASIVSITNAAAHAAAGDSLMSDTSTMSQTSGTTSSGGSGGGLLGGVGSAVGGLVNTTTQTVGGVTNTVGSTVGSTAGTVGRTMNGIQISSSASASSSTTLSSSNKNLRVEKGATFNLRANANGSLQE